MKGPLDFWNELRNQDTSELQSYQAPLEPATKVVATTVVRVAEVGDAPRHGLAGRQLEDVPGEEMNVRVHNVKAVLAQQTAEPPGE